MALDIILNLVSASPTNTQTALVDWGEIVLLIIGAAIGVCSSLITLGLERCWNRRGKLLIHYKAVAQKTSQRGWGFEFSSGDLKWYFTFPVYFEFQNTSNTTRVIRDVNVLLYDGAQMVAAMHQIGPIHLTFGRGSEVTNEREYQFGDEKGSYSFVLSPQSIQRQECLFSFKVEPEERQQYHFDQLFLRYYDEKNRPHVLFMRDIPSCWEHKLYGSDEEWTLLK